jgi:stalled ribosome rescue protein Dom34
MKITMKQEKQKQYAGVWMDNEKAMIIANISKSEVADYKIQEKVKAEETHGGGSEHSMNNARQAGNLKYFKALSKLLLSYDEILVFGPGKSQEQFQHHLQEDAQFKSKEISIDSADQLTNPQVIAKVRDFFKSRPF